jgi:hypothetical protein
MHSDREVSTSSICALFDLVDVCLPDYLATSAAAQLDDYTKSRLNVVQGVVPLILYAMNKAMESHNTERVHHVLSIVMHC